MAIVQANRLDVLLIAADPGSNANTISDHVAAIERYSRHAIFSIARAHLFEGRLPERLRLSHFDAIILHYSVYLLNDAHLDPLAKRRIAEFTGVKVLFVQDEYRQVNRMKEIIRGLGIDVLFTCVPEPEIEKVYPRSELPALVKINTLTGFVAEPLTRKKVPPLRARPVDVAYRARMVPYWLGGLGAEKWQIGGRFLEAVRGEGLVCDVSYQEKDRIYGKRWIEFVSSAKAVLGVESGASVFDFTGEIQRQVEGYVATHPDASFERLRGLFFAHDEGKIKLNQISPRCFEAAALRTAMILFEGEYSGILQRWRHYVPLRKDFSNVREVIAAIRDPDRLQEIADCAYREVAMSEQYSYPAFVARLDDALDRAYSIKGVRQRGARSGTSTSRAEAYSRPGFLLAARPPIGNLLIGRVSRFWMALPEGRRRRLDKFAERVKWALRLLN